MPKKIQLNINMGQGEYPFGDRSLMSPDEYIESFYNPFWQKSDFISVFGYFDGLAYINLDRRIDRKEKLEDNLKEHNIHGNRLPAYDLHGDTLNTLGVHEPYHNGRARGAAASHGKIIHEAKRLGLKNIVIFEDDAQFYDNVSDNIYPIIEELRHTPWDLFYFSCHIATELESEMTRRIKGTEHLYRLGHSCWGAYAYAINHTMYDYYLLEQHTHGFEKFYSQQAHQRVCAHHSPDLCYKHWATHQLLTGDVPLAYTYDGIPDVGQSSGVCTTRHLEENLPGMYEKACDPKKGFWGEN